ncbi:hypothetical protein F5B19DRAFT_371836 [Rostrohypoxylon terebratum]|nr:hypothetical protein F5B19DRAFT_371836 [Rostrohypoxylon terebratum]
MGKFRSSVLKVFAGKGKVDRSTEILQTSTSQSPQPIPRPSSTTSQPASQPTSQPTSDSSIQQPIHEVRDLVPGLGLWIEAKSQIEKDPIWKDSSDKYANALFSIGDPSYGRDQTSKDVVKVVTGAIETLKETNKSDPWFIPLPGGRRVSFDHVLSKMAESVKVMATLGGSLAPLDSTQGAGIACACLKVFAQAVIDGKATRELVADQEPIVHIISYCASIERYYLCTENPSVVDANVLRRLRKSLVDLYVKVLHYQLRVYQYFTDGKLKHAIQSFIPSEFKDLADEVQKQRKVVDDMVREVDMRSSKEYRAKLENLHEPIMKIGSQLQTMATRDKRRHVLDWVSGILPEGSNAKFNMAKPINGTCKWLLTEPEYEKWRGGSTPSFFWLKGKMGAGKTHLTTAVITDIQDRTSHDYVEPVAFYYCDKANGNVEARCEADAIIKSILRQVLSEGSELPESILDIYDKQNERRTDLDAKDAMNILTKAIKTYQQTHVVIDALDELNPNDCDILFHYFKEILRQPDMPIKIFVSSRANMTHIEFQANWLKRDFSMLSVDIHSRNQKDIELFVDQKLEEALEHLSFKGRLSKEDIKDELCNKAGGMFRWVELSIGYLRRSVTMKDFFKRLKAMPKELNELYKVDYRELRDTLDTAAELLDISLRWLMYAQSSQVRKTATFLDIVGSEYEDVVDKDTILVRELHSHHDIPSNDVEFLTYTVDEIGSMSEPDRLERKNRRIQLRSPVG